MKITIQKGDFLLQLSFSEGVLIGVAFNGPQWGISQLISEAFNLLRGVV